MFEGNKAMAKDIRIAGVNPNAIKEAAMIDDTFFDHAEVVVTADLIKKTTGATVYMDVLRCFGDAHKKGNETIYTFSDRMRAWPKIDTGNPDREQPVVAPPGVNDWTKVMDGKRTVWVSYFDTQVLRSPRALALIAEIETQKELMNSTKVVHEKLEYQSVIDTLNNKLSQFKGVWRKGIKLAQCMMAAEEHYPELTIKFRKDADGDILQRVDPVMAWPQEAPLLGQNFTVSQLLSVANVNPKFAPMTGWEVVSSSGETDPQKRWDIFLSTMTREREEDDEDANNVVVDSVNKLNSALASILHFIDSGVVTAQLVSKFEKAKDISEHADFITTIVNTAIELNDLAAKLKQPRKGGKGSLYEQAEAYLSDVTGEDNEAGEEGGEGEAESAA